MIVLTTFLTMFALDFINLKKKVRLGLQLAVFITGITIDFLL